MKILRKIKISNKQFVLIAIITVFLSIITVWLYPYKKETDTDGSTTLSIDEVISLGYLYFGSSSQQISYVTNTIGAINVVSPSYFNINADGTLDATNISKNFIDAMHEKNIQVTPFLSNHWNREAGRAALANTETFTDNLASVIVDNNLDGVNVDIENLNEVDRENHTYFVKRLREKLPGDKIVSVAAVANPRGFTTGWHASYDLSSMEPYVDYFFLMAYDESYKGSAPGPVASIDFVEQSIVKALIEVPANKLILGLPLYGRYWDDSTNQGGDAVTIYRLDLMMPNHEYTYTFDEESKSPFIKLLVKESDKPAYINSSKTLSPGSYTVWYEDPKSIKEKMNLIHLYGLRGSGVWAIGQEYNHLWEYYKPWIQGDYYRDVDVAAWYYEFIDSVSSKGYMQGINDIDFSPTSSVTRAQAITTLLRALGLQTVTYETSSFDDISNNHWAKDYIETAYRLDITTGYDNNIFLPDKIVTREEIAKMLDKCAEYSQILLDITAEEDFADIDDTRWSYESINKMKNANILSGYPDGEFKPEKSLSRAELAKIADMFGNILSK